MSQKSFREEAMNASVVSEAQKLLQEIAPPLAGELMKVRIARAARRVGMTYARAFKVWYAAAKISGEEITTLRRIAHERELTGNVENSGTTKEELWELFAEVRRRLEEIESTLAAFNPGVAREKDSQGGPPQD